jgi:flagellin
MTVRINTNSAALNDLAMENEVVNRRRIGAFYKNTIKRNLNFMRIAQVNVLSRESVIREADTATKMVKYTRNQILLNSQVAMLARASQPPMPMLQLFNE